MGVAHHALRDAQPHAVAWAFPRPWGEEAGQPPQQRRRRPESRQPYAALLAHTFKPELFASPFSNLPLAVGGVSRATIGMH